MNTLINLEEILSNNIGDHNESLTNEEVYDVAIKAMREACLATIELCAQKACITDTGSEYAMFDYQGRIVANGKEYCVAKRSIKDVENLIK